MAADTGPGATRLLADAVISALFSRRIVMIQGDLDLAQASDVAAALMTLDGLGDDHVELRINAQSGDIEAGLVLIDMIDVLGVPVHTVGLGEIGGGAVGVLAAGSERAVSPHARLRLREPETVVEGRAADLERALADRAARRDAFYRQIARFTGRSEAEIEVEWQAGRYLDAGDAVTLGYADSTVVRERPRR